jgi:hypothetical protein
VIYVWKVVEHSDKNLMNSKNIALVFAPNLLKPRVETLATLGDDSSHNEFQTQHQHQRKHVLETGYKQGNSPVLSIKPMKQNCAVKPIPKPPRITRAKISEIEINTSLNTDDDLFWSDPELPFQMPPLPVPPSQPTVLHEGRNICSSKTSAITYEEIDRTPSKLETVFFQS